MAILTRDILLKEATNMNAIYLYERGDKWFAYEHSAYHFSQIFKMGKVMTTSSRICVALSKSLGFLQSKAMCSVQITSVGDSEVQIDCASVFIGFEQWKHEQLVLSTDHRHRLPNQV